VPVLVTKPEDMAPAAACAWATRRCSPCWNRPRAGHKAHRGHRHPLPGLCAARARGGARLRAALRHRHAVLGQHDDGECSTLPGLLDPTRTRHLSRVPRRLPCRAALRRWAGQGPSPSCMLPISQLPADFFPLTCRTCVDYTNVLADITVGYMGGTGAQWLIVRNARGEELLALLGDEVAVETRQRRQARRAGEGLPGQYRTRGGRPAAAAHAGLAAPDRRLADAAHRPARAGIRPRAGRDEGGRDEQQGEQAAPRGSRPGRPARRPARPSGHAEGVGAAAQHARGQAEAEQPAQRQRGRQPGGVPTLMPSTWPP
jgi:hypothetical protein